MSEAPNPMLRTWESMIVVGAFVIALLFGIGAGLAALHRRLS